MLYWEIKFQERVFPARRRKITAAEMNQAEILSILNQNYPFRFDAAEFLRDSGSVAYTVWGGGSRYFLRITKPAFYDSLLKSIDIHLFLQKRGFPVPPILFTAGGEPCVSVDGEDGRRLFLLYEFIEGEEVDPEEDAEEIGGLIGRLHQVMKDYPGPLVRRDRHFYIGRYLGQMRQMGYPRAEEFAAYGDALWEEVKDLPRGYCHGDLYRGNLHKAKDGAIYVLDFDTSCEGFPLYDPVLICNLTDFFTFHEDAYFKSRQVFRRFLPEYQKFSTLTPQEIRAFDRLNALYHFALQATIIEVFGLDCVDHAFLDRQLDWLLKWRKQCLENEKAP